MQIEISLAISASAAESDALQLLTLELDAQPSIETLGLGLADAKALLARMAGGLKWRLWHGRAPEAMRRLTTMLYVLGKSTVCRKPVARQIRRLTLELLGYLRNNSDSLPNYGRRYRAGRRISSAFVESA